MKRLYRLPSLVPLTAARPARGRPGTVSLRQPDAAASPRPADYFALALALVAMALALRWQPGLPVALVPIAYLGLVLRRLAGALRPAPLRH